MCGRMEVNNENEKLISKGIVTQNCFSRKVKFFISLAIVVIIFKGSERISISCFKQYVYFWSKQYLNKTDDAQSDTKNDNGTDGCSSDKDSKSAEDKAQKLSARWFMYFDILNAVLVLFTVVVYGTLSDYIGRKKIGCLTLIGYGLRCTIFAVVIYFDLHIGYCLIAYTVDGICGSSTTFSLYGYTSSADVTSDVRERVLGIALVESLIGVGVMSTEFITGYFINTYGYFYPMVTAAGLSFLSLVLTIIIMDDTNKSFVSDDNQIQTQTRMKTLFPSAGTLLRNFLGFYIGKEQTGKLVFWLCLVIFFMIENQEIGRSNVMTLYQLGQPFCWGSETIGWYEGTYYAAAYFVGIIVLKPMFRVFPEAVSACIGLVSCIVYDIITGLTKTTRGLFIAIAPGFLMILPKSFIRGMTSSRATYNKQGAIFAGLQSAGVFCKLFNGPLTLSVYSHTLDTLNGAVFLMFAGFSIVNLALMMWLCVLLRKERQQKQTIVIVEPTEDTKSS